MQNKANTHVLVSDFIPKKDHEKLLLDYQKLSDDNSRLSSNVEYLNQQLLELKRMIFGAKSERFVGTKDSLQLNMFDVEKAEEPALETEDISYVRRKSTKEEKKKPVRTPIPSHLPRVEEIIEPDNIKEGSIKIGEEITETLECNPLQLFVRKIIRPKYAMPKNEGIIIAELPSLPIPKGNAGASMLAHIMVSKFVDHLPYYRQIQIYKRQGLAISDSTFNGWFNATTNLLEPLYDVLEKQLLSSDYLQADESPIGVQDSHKKGALHTGYQWVYRSPLKGLVLFKYHHSRQAKAPQAVLQTFTGSLQTDGYKAYHNLRTEGQITLLACMAHARRYFEKALNNDSKRAEVVLAQMQRLYEMERKAKDRNVCFATKKRYRKMFARPVLNELEVWMKENITQTLPQSLIGRAIAYTLNLWPKLIQYIEDGRYEIDNNLIENAIRPLALGRKNYLFAGSHKAAQRAAMMYSFFATCKINQVNPMEWLTDILNRIPDHKANRLTELLPQNWKTQSPQR